MLSRHRGINGRGPLCGRVPVYAAKGLDSIWTGILFVFRGSLRLPLCLPARMGVWGQSPPYFDSLR